MKKILPALFLLALPCRPARAADLQALTANLADSDKAAAALEQLVAAKAEALPALRACATRSTDITARGWAIVALSRIGGPEADETLRALQDNADSTLVRTWAAAARIEMAPDFTAVLELAPLAATFPAVQRPFTLRVATLAASGQAVSPEKLISASINNFTLQQVLIEPILGLGQDKLLATMLHAKEQNVRMQAAAYLATLAQRKGESGNALIGTAVAKAFAFEPQMQDVPWAGGPLYVPGLNWDKTHAQNMVGELVRWDVWCDHRGRSDCVQQIGNNVNGVGLAQIAGYTIDWSNGGAVQGVLKTWGGVVGRKGIWQILAQQGVDKEPRYQAVLEGLH